MHHFRRPWKFGEWIHVSFRFESKRRLRPFWSASKIRRSLRLRQVLHLPQWSDTAWTRLRIGIGIQWAKSKLWFTSKCPWMQRLLCFSWRPWGQITSHCCPNQRQLKFSKFHNILWLLLVTTTVPFLRYYISLLNSYVKC